MRAAALLILALFCSVAVLSVRAEDEAPATDAHGSPETATSTTTETTAEPASETEDGFSKDELANMESKKEQFQFQAEVNRLMDIIINSLYSNREVFLRELISNASDALDKIRFLSLTNKALLGEGEQANLDIRIQFDKKAKTITITDRGIGMTKQDLIKQLGVVASSGTTQFLEAAAKGAEPLKLIGQFGVGFYSVYLVADRVTVISKHNDDKQHVWQSSANSVFTVTEDPRGNTLGRGTQIILHLKDDAQEFLDQHTLQRIVSKYSEFIQFPIYLYQSRTVTEEVPDEDAAKEEKKEEEKKEEEEKKSDDDVEVKDEEKKEEEKKPKTKTVSKEVWEWKQVNENKALWTRPPSQVSKDEYEAFYKSLTKDESGPITHLHFNAEGEISFKALLYVPKVAPYDHYDKYYGKSNALKLYVRRVLISDEFEDFMPRYLNFVKGVVDSEDLPLNVSRETLSKSKVLKVMGKKLTRKALEMLKRLAEDSDPSLKKDDDDDDDEEDKPKDKEDKDDKKGKYDEFFKQFGKSIKLGIIEDVPNRSKLAKLVRYTSSKSDGKLISLQQYVKNMKANQKSIYYITGETEESLKNSPFLERLTRRGYEVLLMTDPLDEYVMSHMSEFDGHKFQSATKEGLKFDDESEDQKAKEKALEEEFKPLTEYLKKVYGDKVEKVVVSNRISKSPCVLVTSQYGWSANMERIMRAQTFSDTSRQNYMMSRKTMEINPRHPIIRTLKDKSASAPEDDQVKDLANLMYDSALLASGFTLNDLNDFSSRINRVLSQGLGVDPNAPVEEEPESEPESTKTEEETETVEAGDDSGSASSSASSSSTDDSASFTEPASSSSEAIDKDDL